MDIETVVVGILNTNCYILSKNNHVLVIDPGDEYDKINSTINGRTIDGVIITHSHFDHVGCVNDFPKDLIYDFNNLKEGINKLGEFEFEVIYTAFKRRPASWLLINCPSALIATIDLPVPAPPLMIIVLFPPYLAESTAVSTI